MSSELIAWIIAITLGAAIVVLGLRREVLAELVLRIGALAEAHPEVIELDLNPVIATPDSALAVDAGVRIAATPPRRPWPGTWS